MPIYKVIIERTFVQNTEINVAARDAHEAKERVAGDYNGLRGRLAWSPREVSGVEFFVEPNAVGKDEDEEILF